MSKFSAINLSDDEADAEEHTRELQIEESLKLFKEALSFQKDKNFDDAFKVYEQLFKIDVISDFSPSTATVSNLRYLSYRNRGFLRFDKLLRDQKQRENSSGADADNSELLDELYDDAMSCIEDLITSLVFGDGDTKLVELIYQFFHFFGNDRLTRFLVEYELMKNDNALGSESNLLVRRRNKVSLTFKKTLQKYKQLLTKLNDYDSTIANEDTFLNKNKITINEMTINDVNLDAGPIDLSFLQPLKDEIIANQHNNMFIPREEVIDLSKYSTNEINLSILLKELQQALPRSKTRLKRFFDHYYSTDDPIEAVSIKLPDTNVNTSDIIVIDDEDEDVLLVGETREPSADNEEKIVTGIDDANADTPAEGQTQEEKEQERKRSSRRLNHTAAVEELPKITEIDYSFQQKFLESLATYLNILNEEGDHNFAMEDTIELFTGQNSSFEDTHLHDYIKILETWSPQKSELLLFNADKSKKHISIMEILNANSFSDFVPLESQNVDTYDISGLLASINDSKLHYHQVRIAVLEYALQERDPNALVIDYVFNDRSYQSLKHFLDCSDILLYHKMKDSLKEVQNFGVIVSVLEILIDTYVSIYAELEGNKNAEKHKAASIELLNQQKILSSRIDRWKSLADDLLYVHNKHDSTLFLRFEWCALIYLQHQDHLSPEMEASVKERFSKLLAHKMLKKTDITYVNYQFIRKLNYNNVNVQLSKLNILTTFSNIFKEDSGIGNTEKIDLLEKILFPDASKRKTNEQRNMEKFVKSSTLELKLKLFQILLDHFKKTSSMDKYQFCVEHLISMLHSMIFSNEYRHNSSLARQQEFLRIYGFVGDIMENYVLTLSENQWKISSARDNALIFQKLLDFIRINYIFCLHEDVAFYCALKTSVKSKSVRAFSKLKDIVANNFTLFFIYFESLLKNKKPSYINEILDLLHDQLGCRKFCESAEGKFLKMVQDTLVSLGSMESEKDILQIIYCRYNLQIAVDGFIPVNHETSGIPFDKANALDVAQYVLPICFKKRNPILTSIKADIKVLLDSIYESIGDPDETNESVARCSALLDDFLDNTPLDVRLMRDAFYGLQKLDLKPSKLDLQQAIDNGLYYLQGINSLNLFKLRKRSMQSRIAELDFVIKMFKQDLLCGSARLESWFLLGQAYGFMVEDDLIWTSDKVTNEDKKEGTALLQKKSLLCYLMAINQYPSMEEKKESPVYAMLWSSFGKELYNASMDPMSKLCFNTNGMPTYFQNKSKIFERNMVNLVSDSTLLKILVLSFKMAAKLDEKEWLNHYYLAKLYHKIEEDPDLTLNHILKSCQLAKGNHSDPIVEPHYLLCSLAFKLVQKDRISVETAIDYLSEDATLKVSRDEGVVETKTSFALLVIDCLKQICSIDKKNWHHKPHYRMAKIQVKVFKDVASAKAEMATLINLKPTVKNLVTIWKPEFERPGKHFTYNLQYAMFFIDILTADEDLTSLLALGRKLRRFGASIVQILKAWGHATKNICDLSRKYAHIEPNYSEQCISTIVYGEFMLKAKEFNGYVNARHGLLENEDHQNLLYLFTELGEIKRMSNGFSQTAYIDDTYYCIYLKLYYIYRNEIDENKEAIVVEDVVKSRLAKRDIAEVIKSLNLPKLPEKPVVYKVKEEIEVIKIDDESDIEGKAEVANSFEAQDVANGDEEKKPTEGVAELALQSRKPEDIPSDVEEVTPQFSTPEKNKRSDSAPETPNKRPRLNGDRDDPEVISDDDVFMTPK